MADSRFKNDVMCCLLVLSWVQFSVIANLYFMNFTRGVLVWLTTMVSIILARESNIKVKQFQNFKSQALKERGIHKCCSPFLSSEQLSRHWTSGESVQYSKRLIMSDLVDLSKFYTHVKTSFYFSKLSLTTRLLWVGTFHRLDDPTQFQSIGHLWTGCINSVEHLDRYRKRWDRDIRDLKIRGRDILGRELVTEKSWGEFTVPARQT